MIKKLMCNKNDSLIEVMKTINENAMGMAFVTDKDDKLCGIITDGDIRRSLLNDIGLQEKVKNIISKEYTFGRKGESQEELIKKISHKIKIIPIIDSNNKIIDFFEYNQNTYFPVAIPAFNGNEFKYLTDAFMSSWISSSGEYIGRFENDFAQYSDCKHGVSVSNGTAALHLSLVALDIGKGDEVIIPDLTFAATINAVLHANATPVIVDIEEDSWCIDPDAIEKAITSKTKAIIPVHIYGQVCDMDKIMAIAHKHNLKVIEDCAEAHGAKYSDKRVGSFGDVGCFSFFGNKVITTGEGGMCTTNNPLLDEKMRILRDHGMSKTKRYWHDMIGFNYRMTNLQAAIGLAQLERIDDIHSNRQFYEEIYKRILKNIEYIIFQNNNLQNREKITWLTSILIDQDVSRDEFIKKLKDNGIDARAFFYPLSDMEIYKSYCKEFTKTSHKISEMGLNLPTYENLKNINGIRDILLKLHL